MRHRLGGTHLAVALGATLIATLAACSSGSIPDLPGARGGRTQGSSGADGGAGGVGTPGTPGAPTGETTTDGEPVIQCGDEMPGPRLLRLLTREEWAATVTSLLGLADPGEGALPESARIANYDNNAVASVVSSRVMDVFATKAEELATRALKEARGTIVPCSQTDASCKKTFVESFGKRAFRRPLTAEESARYVGLFSEELTGGAFDEGARLVVQTMLGSPNFLYRSEIGEAAEGGYKLGPYEVATALSYALTGDMPDAALFAAAEQQKLATNADLEIEARRLLATPKGKKQTATFFRQWLGLAEKLPGATKDTTVYGQFDSAARDAMFREHDAFVDAVVYDGTRTFGELFNAKYTFLDGRLAELYKMPGAATGTAMTKVDTTNSPRGGLLTLGGLLTGFAHADESSPILRGIFFRNRILCQTLPPPPPLTSFPDKPGTTRTTRERFAAHTSAPACKACHQFIDGIGFAFERFDGIGVYRETENGKAIDATGDVVGMEDMSPADVKKVDGVKDLEALVAESPNAQACFAANYYRYTRGYKENKSDECAVRSLEGAFKDGGLDVQKLFISTVLQSSFTNRREGGL